MQRFLSDVVPDSLTQTLSPRRVPSRTGVVTAFNALFEVLFTEYLGHEPSERKNIVSTTRKKLDRATKELSREVLRAIEFGCDRRHPCAHCKKAAQGTMSTFLASLGEIKRLISLDVQAAYDGDPAAKSLTEVVLSYPGLLAITAYRLAHPLHLLGVPLLPRMMTEYAHSETGIDIHPGARIGESFFIDHGTGVVIGETTEIGRNVKIYQGVTLGALSFPKDERGRIIREGKRHPTIEDDVVIYAGATILGGQTVIGRGSVIGGNTWVTQTIPAGSRVLRDPQEQRIEQR